MFQEGHLSWLAWDLVNTRSLDTSTIIVSAIVAFGLSMDYEVFLLSRIKEEYDRAGDNTAAVTKGLQRSAGIITAAALLLVPAFMRIAGRANLWAPAPLRRVRERFGSSDH